MIRVKVCCIASVEEAELAIGMGASALGLVSSMPSGPGVISDSLIAEISGSVPPPVGTFLLTSRTDPSKIVEQQRSCRVNTIQLCDGVTPATHAALRESLPGCSLVQVIHVRGAVSVEEAKRVAPSVDALLLDSGNPTLATKVLGGTGRTHNWGLSARIVEEAPIPVFLAGGLNPNNVGEAIRSVRPFGVDLCTGVRTAEKLDSTKLAAFFEAVEAAG